MGWGGGREGGVTTTSEYNGITYIHSTITYSTVRDYRKIEGVDIKILEQYSMHFNL